MKHHSKIDVGHISIGNWSIFSDGKFQLFTVFKNKLLTNVDAPTNGWCHENHCVK